MTDGIVIDRRPDGVTIVTLDRPAVLNAMTRAMHDALGSLWTELDRDRETRVVLVTGAGRAFSAGNDLNQAATTAAELPEVGRRIAALLYGIVEMQKPVVSAVRGAAVGAGLVLALAADISVVADDAFLLDGQTRVGVAAGEHAVLLWPLLSGMAKAKYLLCASQPLTGREAERIGLVSVAVPADDVLDCALEIAVRLAAGPQQAQRWTKRALAQHLLRGRAAFEQSLALELLGITGPDATEARGAFREKREPIFGARQ